MRSFPVPDDAAYLSRLRSLTGGGMTAAMPTPVLGSRRRSLTERLVLECVGLTPLGWAVAMAPNGGLSEVPPELWGEYEEAAVE